MLVVNHDIILVSLLVTLYEMIPIKPRPDSRTDGAIRSAPRIGFYDENPHRSSAGVIWARAKG